MSHEISSLVFSEKKKKKKKKVSSAVVVISALRVKFHVNVYGIIFLFVVFVVFFFFFLVYFSRASCDFFSSSVPHISGIKKDKFQKKPLSKLAVRLLKLYKVPQGTFCSIFLGGRVGGGGRRE